MHLVSKINEIKQLNRTFKRSVLCKHNQQNLELIKEQKIKEEEKKRSVLI